jgi:2'-5' RNA ligase
VKSFRTYMVEEVKPRGNYVALDCNLTIEDVNEIYRRADLNPPASGVEVPNGDYHCTLIYSKETNLDPDSVRENILSSGLKIYIIAGVTSFECFDSIPEAGMDVPEKSCIVAKLQNINLHKIHDHLRGLGLRHSYAEYSPHVTLRYNMDVAEAHMYRDLLNSLTVSQDFGFHFVVELSNLRSEGINEDYV